MTLILGDFKWLLADNSGVNPKTEVVVQVEGGGKVLRLPVQSVHADGQIVITCTLPKEP